MLKSIWLFGSLLLLWMINPNIAPAQQTINQPQATNQSQAISQGASDRMRIYALRLRPGQDLKVELDRFTKANNIQAGFIITTVGSLQQATIRLADQSDLTVYREKLEIVSLVGTLSATGNHLHISISDKTGKTIGGHLADGSLIYTTAEIVIGEASDLQFTREQDEQSGYRELVVKRKKRCRGKR